MATSHGEKKVYITGGIGIARNNNNSVVMTFKRHTRTYKKKRGSVLAELKLIKKVHFAA